MKKVVVSVLLVLALVACGGGSRPEDTVNGFFTTLKNADFEKLGAYMEDAGNLGKLSSLKPEARELIKTMFGQLQTTLGASEVKGSEAVVSVKLSFVNVQSAMKNLEGEFNAMVKKLMLGATSQNREQLQLEMQKEVLGLFKKAMSAPNVARVSEDAKVNLVKVGNAWKLSRDQRFGNQLFEGLDGVLRLAR
jgi:hypothetical protein